MKGGEEKVGVRYVSKTWILKAQSLCFSNVGLFNEDVFSYEWTLK